MAITKLIADSITSGAIASTPSFEAILSADVYPADATNTKLSLDSEIFDTDGCYNNTGSTVTLNGISVPSYSFAPNVAGKYYIFAQVLINPTGSNNVARGICDILKNNNAIATSDLASNTSSNFGFITPSVAIITELNGTSDYVHASGYSDNTSDSNRFKGDATIARTFFGAYRIIE